MYNQPYSQAPCAQGAQQPFPAYAMPTPPTPPALPLSAQTPQSPVPSRSSLQKSPQPPGRKQASLNGSIEQDSLRFFNNGVTRFKFRQDNPGVPLASCVMFRSVTNTLPADLLSLGKRLEVRGFSRQNTWTDKRGNTHSDVDFVVVFVQEIQNN